MEPNSIATTSECSGSTDVRLAAGAQLYHGFGQVSKY